MRAGTVRERKSTSQPEITPEQIDDLTQAVVSLTEQVRVLRQAVDEIGDELGWAIRNRVVTVQPLEAVSPRPCITSFPADPSAVDFHERINAVRASDLPADSAVVGMTFRPGRQGKLW